MSDPKLSEINYISVIFAVLSLVIHISFIIITEEYVKYKKTRGVLTNDCLDFHTNSQEYNTLQKIIKIKQEEENKKYIHGGDPVYRDSDMDAVLIVSGSMIAVSCAIIINFIMHIKKNQPFIDYTNKVGKFIIFCIAGLSITSFVTSITLVPKYIKYKRTVERDICGCVKLDELTNGVNIDEIKDIINSPLDQLTDNQIEIINKNQNQLEKNIEESLKKRDNLPKITKTNFMITCIVFSSVMGVIGISCMIYLISLWASNLQDKQNERKNIQRNSGIPQGTSLVNFYFNQPVEPGNNSNTSSNDKPKLILDSKSTEV